MKKTIKSLLLSISAMLLVITASAQVTTSSLNGRVAEKEGASIPGAAVVATHTPSGTTYYAITNEEGRFTINGMRSGGPYSVEVSCLGYQTVTYTDITLQLGESYGLNASLADDKEMLSEAMVVSTASSRFATEKTGAATNISNNQIVALPTVSRSLTDVTKLSPYGGNGMTFGGSDGRFSNFTVDGANFNNNFGLSSSLPGGGSPISLDAIEEAQVVISPYDVRQSDFIGGGVNAITKSGTNTFKATAYVYHRNENMRGNVAAGTEVAGARDYERNTTYGFTLGGPIIKNKLFFFASFETAQVPTVVNKLQASKDGVADADKNISRTKASDMELVKNHLMEKYGYDTGSYTDFSASEGVMKFLGRIDWNINDNHNLAVRYNYTLDQSWSPTNGSSSNCDIRATQNRFSQYSMSFYNSMYSSDKLANTFSFDLNIRLSDNLSNQLLVTYSLLDDRRGSPSEPFPFIDILDGTAKTDNTYIPYMAAGYELFTWNNGYHNRVVTAKDDVTYFSGNHKFTAGASYEYQMADNVYMRNGTGYYRYYSLEDFLSQAVPETVALTYGYNGKSDPAARVRYHKLALYGQDEWNVSDNFKLTAGVRLETILFDNRDVMTNNAILGIDYGGLTIDTGSWPKSKLQLSPRVGFTWDVFGNDRVNLRGGTGLFTGRMPLVFLTNMPSNAGMYQNVAAISTATGLVADPLLAEFKGPMLMADELLAKMHELDPKRFPLEITPKDGMLPKTVQAVDPNFSMPRVWKSSLALDLSLPTSFPVTLTGEFIFNKTIDAVFLTNPNIKPISGYSRYNGIDNRHVYPANFKYTGTDAYYLVNTDEGYGYQASVQLNAQPTKNLSINAAYTRSVAKEISDMPGSNAESAYTYTPTVEGPNNIKLHNAYNTTPDRAFVSVSYKDGGDNSYSLFYEAFRGGYNYSYMSVNDLNNDGYNYDLIYVPTKEEIDQMRFDKVDDRERFWDYVNNDPYLSSIKGQYAEAYSVYSPWVNRLDFRYTHDFKVKVGNNTNTLQLSLDVKNILNLVNSDWGVMKYMNPDLQSGRIIKLERVTSDGYPVYSTPAAVHGDTQTWKFNPSIGQCWYAQIGLKYLFN